MSILSELFAPTNLDKSGPVELKPPAPRPERILVVGAGPVGHALAGALERAGFPLRHWSRSEGPLWEESSTREPADIVLLAVRDEAIAQAAQFVVEHGAAGPASVLLHCAGALAPQEALGAQRDKVAGIGLLHPLRSFARLAPGTKILRSGPPAPALNLHGTVIAVCGDERGVHTAEELGKAIGGVVLKVPAERLPAYHAAAVLAAGHAAALLDTAVHLLRRIGLEQRPAEQALASLTRSVVDNITDVGLPDALTGPFARGDATTVAKHLEALSRISLEATSVYRALGYAALDVAHHKGSAEPAELARIQALLDACRVEPATPPATGS